MAFMTKAVSIRRGSDLKVRIVESIDNVPAKLEELLPFQQDAVKEAEGEEHLPVEYWFGAAVELSLRHQLVQTLHVGFHTLRTEEGRVNTMEGYL